MAEGGPARGAGDDGWLERLRASRGRIELLGEHLRRHFECAQPGDQAAPALAWGALAMATERLLLREWDAGGRRDGVFEWTRTSADAGRSAGPFAPRHSADAIAAGIDVALAGVRPAAPPRKSVAARAHADELLAQARTRGFDELLWCSADGALLGATAMNLFLVRGAELLTPSVGSGAWPGILRRAVLIAARELAPRLGFAVREATLGRDELATADDAFLAGSAEGIVPVRSIDGRALPPPPRGSAARKLVPQLKLRVYELCSERFLPEA